MVRRTDEQDAEIQKELELEIPKVAEVVAKAERHLRVLSDIGQLAALYQMALRYYVRETEDERTAIDAVGHFCEELVHGIKSVYSDLDGHKSKR
ncbi:hypothetical protein M2281_002557 [Mesorhizobium soli]|uniref:hypothetical protein n=1 Tax=Pseudaminobacter soli (ex Li et al. 2025) TaxID=1295366 RepID=UPI002476CBBC|nr:hypothetical protein [Mesorhizobium soli]MDH6231959.1 hypothetical protein [Mesorhizobium soli]